MTFAPQLSSCWCSWKVVVCFRIPGGLGSNFSKTTLWMKLAVYDSLCNWRMRKSEERMIRHPERRPLSWCLAMFGAIAPINPLEDVMSICFDRLFFFVWKQHNKSVIIFNVILFLEIVRYTVAPNQGTKRTNFLVKSSIPCIRAGSSFKKHALLFTNNIYFRRYHKGPTAVPTMQPCHRWISPLDHPSTVAFPSTPYESGQQNLTRKKHSPS